MSWSLQVTEIMLGKCDRTLTLDPAFKYATETVIVVRQLQPSIIWPAQAYLYGAGGICGGTYVQTYTVDTGITGVMIDSTLRKITFDPILATLNVPFMLALTATWKVGIKAQLVHAKSQTITVKVTSLWFSTQLKVSAPQLASTTTIYTVAQILSSSSTKQSFNLAYS